MQKAMIPKLDEHNNVVGYTEVDIDDRPRLYLLRHPKTGKVTQVVVVGANGPGVNPEWAREHIKAIVDSEPAVIMLNVEDDYDVVIV